jgi:hypothetical protein
VEGEDLLLLLLLLHGSEMRWVGVEQRTGQGSGSGSGEITRCIA